MHVVACAGATSHIALELDQAVTCAPLGWADGCCVLSWYARCKSWAQPLIMGWVTCLKTWSSHKHMAFCGHVCKRPQTPARAMRTRPAGMTWPRRSGGSTWCGRPAACACPTLSPHDSNPAPSFRYKLAKAQRRQHLVWRACCALSQALTLLNQTVYPPAGTTWPRRSGGSTWWRACCARLPNP